MVLDIVKSYILLVSEFFNLSDVTLMASATTSILPQHIPADSTSFAAAHFLQRILGELQDCVNDVCALDVSSDIGSSLRSLMESAKWRFDDILINYWLQG